MAKTENKTSSSERGFYIKCSVKVGKDDKAKFMKLKKELGDNAKYSLSDAQVSEYIVRTYLENYS